MKMFSLCNAISVCDSARSTIHAQPGSVTEQSRIVAQLHSMLQTDEGHQMRILFTII
eukprot:COSAG04_NODE_29041_length_271_cov_1.209302_1_plen_56_part_10